MTLIATVQPENARGEVQKGYALFTARGVAVPHPIRLLSTSPELFKLMIQRNEYYSHHPKLSFALLAHIRYFVSTKLDYTFCAMHNKNLLMLQGMEESDIARMGIDPDKSMLEAHERHMAAFVLKAMAAPESIEKADMDALHAAGWRDSDILDALAQGVGMIDHSIFMRAFKPDF